MGYSHNFFLEELKVSYADSGEVTRKIEKLDVVTTIDSDLLNDAITTADELVDAELVEATIPSTTPDSIKKAATLLAQAEYLDGITPHGSDRSPTAVAWEAKAYRIINGWLNENKAGIPTGGYNRRNSSKYRPFRGSKKYYDLVRRTRRW